MENPEPSETSLLRADALLRGLRPPGPSAEEALVVRRALAEEVRGGPAPEVMTPEEVAAFLRLDEADLARVADELPAFELAGRIRIRRRRLLEWVERRERSYARAAAAAAVKRGVA